MQFVLRRLSSFWTLQLIGWGALLIVSNAPYIFNIRELWARELIVYRSALVVCFVAASFPLHTVCRHRWRLGLPIPKSIFIVLVWCFVLSYLSTAIAFAAETASGGNRQFDALAMAGSACLGGIVLLSWCGLYFGVKNLQALETERHRALILEHSAREAQLRALQYQIHPHFLFNTLNAISTLIAEEQNDDAERMVTRLADYFRATLERRVGNEAPFEDELFLTRQYLEIEKARLGERLKIQITADSASLKCLVPHLVLQPLVENAIRHGIAPRHGPGSVSIDARTNNDKLLITVSDDGLGRQVRSESGNGNPKGIGLTNTETRMQNLYGELGRIDLRWPVNGGCEAVLEIPYHQNEIFLEGRIM